MTAAVARVFDLETTGLPDEEGAEVIEVGFYDVDLTDVAYPVSEGWQSLCKPRGPIPPTTMAVHHITPADVENSPPLGEAWLALGAGMTPSDIYVAHNAKFEQAFYTGRPQAWVCTYRCALRAWPEAPGHSNQVLRYWLGLDIDPARAQPPHRALPDAYVTAHILRRLLQMRPVSRLIEVSAEPALLPKVNFGKHRGMKFAEVPRGYLEWVADQKDMDEDIRFTAKHYLKRKAA